MIGALILSHGRPDNVKTIQALKKAGYTGEIKIVCDDLDKTLDKYKENFGKDVIVFDKMKKLEECDTMDNFGKTNIVLPARNECNNISKRLGWDYFFELDDDYSEFNIRYPKDGKLKSYKIKDMDGVLNALIEFLEASNATTVCFSQAGDYIGGAEGGYIYKGLARKAMNCYVCKTDRPLQFIGSINEDVNMYVTKNMRGERVFSISMLSVNQGITQSNEGGLTDFYLENGTYIKSFYSVIAEPSCVKVGTMGNNDRRLHHRVSWGNCAPMILSESLKKGARSDGD
jgi:hypothetical protein